MQTAKRCAQSCRPPTTQKTQKAKTYMWLEGLPKNWSVYPHFNIETQGPLGYSSTPVKQHPSGRDVVKKYPIPCCKSENSFTPSRFGRFCSSIEIMVYVFDISFSVVAVFHWSQFANNDLHWSTSSCGGDSSKTKPLGNWGTFLYSICLSCRITWLECHATPQVCKQLHFSVVLV